MVFCLCFELMLGVILYYTIILLYIHIYYILLLLYLTISYTILFLPSQSSDLSSVLLFFPIIPVPPNPHPSPLLFPPIPLIHSFYTCRYFHMFIYIPGSSSNRFLFPIYLPLLLLPSSFPIFILYVSGLPSPYLYSLLIYLPFPI